MKKFLLGLLIVLSFTASAQYQKGGVVAVGSVAVMQLDTNARNIIKIIEDERVAGGGALFSTSEKQYVNYIVTNLKVIGVWQKCKAIYGFVGGTSASHKWNWKDMRDLDVAFRLTFTGGVTHSSNGVQFNGTDGYANTYLVPASVLSNTSTNATVYIKESTGIVGSPYILGAIGSPASGNNFGLTSRHGVSTLKLFVSSNPTVNDNAISSITSSTLGVYGGNLNGGILSLWWKGKKIEDSFSSTAQSALPDISLVIGGNSAMGGGSFGVGNFDQKLLNYVKIGDGLTDAQIIQETNIVTFAQGILGRK